MLPEDTDHLMNVKLRLLTGFLVYKIAKNLPFHSAERFVIKCVQNSRRKFALLLHLALLKGSSRYGDLVQTETPYGSMDH